MEEIIRVFQELFTNNIVMNTLTIFIFSLFAASISLITYHFIFKKRRKEAGELINKFLDIATGSLIADAEIDLRANVFLPNKARENALNIVFYSSSMIGAPDINIILEKWQGCTGMAWGYEAAIIADLTVPGIENGVAWRMTKNQMEITKDIKAILSLPIKNPKNPEKIIGILSFDSTTPIANVFEKDEIIEKASLFAAQVGEMLWFHKLV